MINKAAKISDRGKNIRSMIGKVTNQQRNIVLLEGRRNLKGKQINLSGKIIKVKLKVVVEDSMSMMIMVNGLKTTQKEKTKMNGQNIIRETRKNLKRVQDSKKK
jgi:hypothetical protein